MRPPLPFSKCGSTMSKLWVLQRTDRPSQRPHGLLSTEQQKLFCVDTLHLFKNATIPYMSFPQRWVLYDNRFTLCSLPHVFFFFEFSFLLNMLPKKFSQKDQSPRHHHTPQILVSLLPLLLFSAGEQWWRGQDLLLVQVRLLMLMSATDLVN